MLFKTTVRLVSYANLASTVNFSNVSPTIRTVEEQHIIPLLGKELYNALNTAYTSAAVDESDLSATNKALLEMVRNVIGPLVCYYYAPKAEVIVSDAGVHRQETNSNHTAFQNQVVNFKEINLLESENATEQLLQFLEDKKADYPTWQTGDGFADYRSLFIKTGTEFKNLFPSHSPCRNYFAMRPRMKDVEENGIRKLLGDDLYNTLKQIDLDPVGVFTDIQKDLVFKIKKAVAYLTVAEAIPFLNVRIDTNGLTVKSTARAQDDLVASRTAASERAISNYIDACKSAGKDWINSVQDWIDTNTTNAAIPIPDVITGNIDRIGSFGMF
jgi:hypothetical protein